MSHPRHDASFQPNIAQKQTEQKNPKKTTTTRCGVSLPLQVSGCIWCEGILNPNYLLNDFTSLYSTRGLFPAKPLANFTLCGSKNQFPLTMLWCSPIWGHTPPILHPVPLHNFRAGSCGSPAGPLTCTLPPLQLPPELTCSSP